MKNLVRIEVVLLVAFTAFGMALQQSTSGSWTETPLVSLGFAVLYPFDLLLLGAIFLLALQTRARPQGDPIAANRTILLLVLIYLVFELGVMAPVAVFFYGLSPVGVLREMTTRIALVLIPFFYLVGLRYVRPRDVVSLINFAAVVLAAYAAYRYASGGMVGWYEEGEYRLRVLWGGSSLLFGWLVLSSLFLRRANLVAYVAALMGIAGLALTNQRSGYVALAAAVAVQLLSGTTVPRRVALGLAVVVTATVLVFSLSPTIRQSAEFSITSLLTPGSDVTAQDRVQRSELAWQYFKTKPLGDHLWTQTYYLVDLGTEAFEPHNFVIELLAQQGLIAASLEFAILGGAVWLGWRNRWRDRLSCVMMSYLVFFLVFSFFNVTIDNELTIVLLSLPIAVILHQNRLLHRWAAIATRESSTQTQVRQASQTRRVAMSADTGWLT